MKNKDASEINTVEFSRVVHARRAVRGFEATPVPPQVIDLALDHALLAPSSSNLQYGEFYWVQNSSTKAALIHACFGQRAVASAQELVVCVARTDLWNRNRKLILKQMSLDKTIPQKAVDYYAKLIPGLYKQGPLGIFNLFRRAAFGLGGLFKAVPRSPVSKADMRILASTSTALACENFMLSIKAQGYDTCPIGGFDECLVRRIVGTPKSANIVMVISVGKAAADGIYGARTRLDRELFVKKI